MAEKKPVTGFTGKRSSKPKLKVAKKKKLPMIERRDSSRNLKCDLSEKEVRASADALARHLDERAALELKKKDVMEQIKAEVAGCELQIIKQKNLVRNKYEFRDVKCEVIKDYKKSTLTVKRLDTKKVVSTRKLVGDEKQRGFGFCGSEVQPED